MAKFNLDNTSVSIKGSSELSPIKLSKDIFFYMETRGISEKKAKEILRKGLLKI